MILKYLGRCGSPAGAIRCRKEGQTTWTLTGAPVLQPGLSVLCTDGKRHCAFQKDFYRVINIFRVLKGIGWQSHFLGKALIPQWWEK